MSTIKNNNRRLQIGTEYTSRHVTKSALRSFLGQSDPGDWVINNPAVFRVDLNKQPVYHSVSDFPE